MLLTVVAVGAGTLAATRDGAAFLVQGALSGQTGRSSPPRATLAAVVDGETLDVRAGADTVRIRLLDVATPAAPAQDRPGQCLGREAAAFLAGLMPAGTELTLTYAEDRLGRTGATAATPDGTVVNRELVRAGFAEVIAPADGRSTADLETAAQEAVAARRGLHSPDLPCTVPGQVEAVLDQVARIPAAAPPGGRGGDLFTLANNATRTRVAAERLAWTFTQDRNELAWRVLGEARRAELTSRLADGRERAAAAETELRTAANLALNADATRGAAQAESARVARQLLVIRRAEARRAAAAARRAEAARQAEASRRADERARTERRGSTDQDDERSSSGGSRNDSRNERSSDDNDRDRN